LSEPISRLARRQTLLYFASFIALGLVVGAFGPAISAMASSQGFTLATISPVFVTYGAGRIAGSLIAGTLLKRTRSHVLTALAMVAAAAAALALASTGSVAALALTALALGFAINCIDVAVNASIVKVHGAGVGPFLNALHATFGVGGALAPLLIGRSLAWTDGVVLAFAIIGVCLLATAGLIVTTASPSLALRDATGFGSTPPRGLMLALIALFFFLVGVEALMLQFTYQFGVLLGLTRDGSAPALASLLWWTYTAGRVIAIPISLRLGPRALALIDFAGTLACVALLTAVTLAGPNATSPALWASIALLGLFVASAFPSTVGWVSSAFNIDSQRLGVLFAASNVGAVLVSWSYGQLVERFGAPTLPTAALGFAAATLITAVAISITSRRTHKI
jgi:predicted MFS family arabinose efflux permease